MKVKKILLVILVLIFGITIGFLSSGIINPKKEPEKEYIEFTTYVPCLDDKQTACLLEALKKSGIKRIDDRYYESIDEVMLNSSDRAIFILEEPEYNWEGFTVYEYQSTEGLETDKARINIDGTLKDTDFNFLKENPKWYTKGNIIISYNGINKNTLTLLEKNFDKPFAQK